MTGQWQRSTTSLRAGGPMRMAPCIGCPALALSDDAWSVCAECRPIASAWIQAQVGALPGWQQRDRRRQFWRSAAAVRAAVAEQRKAVTA
jgi:hypothetical protein